MNMFQQALVTESNLTLTENGAVTNTSTLDHNLDFFYHAPAKRGQPEVEAMFFKALSEDPATATQIMFYLRDPRGGQGERNSFRRCLTTLKNERPTIFAAVSGLVSEYGRWDDILTFVDDEYVGALVMVQLHKDVVALSKGESVSLLAKWMPSINTSSKATQALGRKWAKVLNFSEKKYRQTLSALRKQIDIVESKMSANKWGDVNYSAVPSRASLLYKEAFKKHDATRYGQFIEKAVTGEVKINSAVLFPYDIVEKYSNGHAAYDATLEALWNQLPNYADSTKNALVVADVSGSMHGKPLQVCLSLAVYIAERNTGCFHNQFITFSSNPTLQSLVGKTLREKLVNLSQAQWDMDTNLEAVFDLVLNAAIKNKVPQSELPDSIFIISDMEFNACIRNGNMSNFASAQANFAAAGYTIPKIIFWNVDSRNMQSPVTKDEKGVYLVSGCSPSIFQKAVNASATTPMEMMMEVLDNPRYAPVKAVLQGLPL
jgi:hypothetical protein